MIIFHYKQTIKFQRILFSMFFIHSLKSRKTENKIGTKLEKRFFRSLGSQNIKGRSLQPEKVNLLLCSLKKRTFFLRVFLTFIFFVSIQRLTCEEKSCCCNCLPSLRSHDLTVLSKPPVHNFVPSAEISIQEAPSVWP